MLNNPHQVLIGDRFQPVLPVQGQDKRILLSRKTQLPIGYGPEKHREKLSKMTEENENSDDDKSDDEDANKAKETIVRPKNETKEEKRIRKQEAKDNKRAKRNIKREIKGIYKSVELKQVTHFASQQDINNAHVFKTVA
jgi:protein LTV1